MKILAVILLLINILKVIALFNYSFKLNLTDINSNEELAQSIAIGLLTADTILGILCSLFILFVI